MIRSATTADIPALTGMGERFHEASALGDIVPFDADSFAQTVRHMLHADDAFILVLDDNGPRGMIGAMVYPVWFNLAHRAAQELFWWAEPDWRGGVDLLWAMEAEAGRRGAGSVSMLCLDGLRDKAIDRLYRMKGYRPMEHSYVKAI